MPEDTPVPHDQLDINPARHRRPRWHPGNRWLITGAAALVGLGLTGVAVTANRADEPQQPTAVVLDADARAEADARADRSVRESAPPASPTPSPTTASPSPSATTAAPSASASTPAPTRKATRKATATAKPKPEPTRAKTASAPKPSWVNPMPGASVTSCYGPRWGVLHAGIDLAAPAGTPVRAAAAGTVVNAGWDFAGYGISVVLDHGNGYLTHYAHLSEATVAVGASVDAGQRIGSEGSTGDSTGPHLHFEVHQGQLWNQLDPAPFMRERGVDLGC
ncbi:MULTISPECIES: M23 family metallopeptidase [Micromonospora]|uniref:Murein DD-endopeptidase MepM and murein hydrolase activator NlpD, contain LysM domain n=1 Tax=Micromonospora yangpuensis TaxID=683228 RepID=A0A1C6V9N1_9ACTN|nr:M23 family metallopeptidase [Micromonospora yangpuensis]GGM22125.1 hypothetical protein GCM10012279_45610 [Micromonospora yangpuensis]SCL62975.1 Murein DD-endopeptidase MepM and murein hydrolase activator NlpD, contain LysM domain [Micromonospora yangpuensis]